MRNRTITYNGVTLTILEWARRTKQNHHTLRYRIDAGWPIEEALFRSPERTGYGLCTNGTTRGNVEAEKIKRAFERLVTDIDRALKVYKARTDWLFDTPGMVNQQQNDRCDRTIPSAQDSPKLEIS